MYKMPMENFCEKQSKWYGIIIPLDNFSISKYYDMLDWLYVNVELPIRHARWRVISEGVEVRFRYERDYLKFMLRWL